MAMKRLLFILTLLGLEGQAWAHEDPAPLSTEPIDWLLPIAAYAIPGVLLIVILNEFFANVRIGRRLFGSVVFPALFWTFLLFVILPTEVTLFELLGGAFGFLLFDIGLAVWVPAGVMIVLAGLMDQRRREKADMADRYSEL
jgi:hypothetical protein